MLLFSSPHPGHLWETPSVSSYTGTDASPPLRMFILEMLQMLGILFPQYTKRASRGIVLFFIY